MNSNRLTAVLLGLLLVVALLTAFFSVSYNLRLLSLRRLQPKVATYANNRALMQALAGELLEYSKRDPAIDPLLQSVGLKATNPAPTQPATARPTTK